MLRNSNAVRGKLAELQVVAALESVGIATNLLTMDDNGLDLSCQIPALPLTSKKREDIRGGSPFTWEMSFETISIQVKSGGSSVKVRDLLGWDAANKSSPLGARIMVVWLEHKKPDNLWVFDPDAISSITKRLRANQRSVTLSAKAYRNAAVEFDCTKPEVLGRYLWLWSNCPVALKFWEQDIFYCAQIPTWPTIDELEDIAYEFLRWTYRAKGPRGLQSLYDEGREDSKVAGDALLECRNLIIPFYLRNHADGRLYDHVEAAKTAIHRLSIGNEVWEDSERYWLEGPAGSGWVPPVVDRECVVEQFNKLYDFLLSENG